MADTPASDPSDEATQDARLAALEDEEAREAAEQVGAPVPQPAPPPEVITPTNFPEVVPEPPPVVPTNVAPADDPRLDNRDVSFSLPLVSDDLAVQNAVDDAAAAAAPLKDSHPEPTVEPGPTASEVLEARTLEDIKRAEAQFSADLEAWAAALRAEKEAAADAAAEAEAAQRDAESTHPGLNSE